MSATATKHRTALAVADRLCDKLIDVLGPSCERIEVAGSVRRRCVTVGDVELVAIARTEADGLFPHGPRRSVLETALGGLVWQKRLEPIKGGERYKQFMVGAPGGPRIKLDLWIVTRDTWGVQFAIRTGGAAFSKSLVTPLERGGRLRNGLIVREGRVWRADEVTVGFIDFGGRQGAPFFQPRDGAQPLDTPQEADFLELAGGWVEPEQRSC